MIELPATAVAAPSVFVIARSAFGASVSVSVAELFAVDGSVTPVGAAMVAVLLNEPVAPEAMLAVSEYVAVPPDNRFAVVLIEPEPEAAPQLEPPDATHVHVALLNDAGSVSVMVASVTDDGPAFVATIV